MDWLRRVLTSNFPLERLDGDRVLQLMIRYPDVAVRSLPLLPLFEAKDVAVVRYFVENWCNTYHNKPGGDIKIVISDIGLELDIYHLREAVRVSIHVKSNRYLSHLETFLKGNKYIHDLGIVVYPCSDVRAITALIEEWCMTIPNLESFHIQGSDSWGKAPAGESFSVSRLIRCLLDNTTIANVSCVNCDISVDSSVLHSISNNNTLMRFTSTSFERHESILVEYNILFNKYGKKRARIGCVDDVVELLSTVSRIANTSRVWKLPYTTTKNSVKQSLVFTILLENVGSWCRYIICTTTNDNKNKYAGTAVSKKHRACY